MMLSTSLTMWFFLPIVLAGNTAGNDYGNGNTAGHGNGDGNTAGDGNTEREVITERTHLLIDEALNIPRRARSGYFDPRGIVEFVRLVRRRFAAEQLRHPSSALSNSEGAAVDSTGSPTVQSASSSEWQAQPFSDQENIAPRHENIEEDTTSVNRAQAVDSSGNPTVQVIRFQAEVVRVQAGDSSGSPTLLDALTLLTPFEEQQAIAQHNETAAAWRAQLTECLAQAVQRLGEFRPQNIANTFE